MTGPWKHSRYPDKQHRVIAALFITGCIIALHDGDYWDHRAWLASYGEALSGASLQTPGAAA